MDWTVTYVEYPKTSPVKQFTLHWEVTEGDARVYGSVSHELDPGITQAAVKKKTMADLVQVVKEVLGSDEVAATEAAVTAQLAEIASPSVEGFVPA